MHIEKELLPGLLKLRTANAADGRGLFVKTFARTALLQLGVDFVLREEFWTTSHKGVIRGMHFQTPPHAHSKFVSCVAGSVLDVLLDLRAGPGYGKVESIVLSPDDPCILFVPRGVAHGFLALEEQSVMVYKTDAEYAPANDSGVLWNSFDFDWGLVEPNISVRDRQFARLQDFTTPFSDPTKEQEK